MRLYGECDSMSCVALWCGVANTADAGASKMRSSRVHYMVSSIGAA
ncbi:MAG: hypothetical protein IJW18_00810 [Lachnospiraceae bacterium]|nr:hypothetical protein [Lachnospiraceae bacterium]